MLQGHFRAARVDCAISSIILCTNPMILPGTPTGYKASVRIPESPQNFTGKDATPDVAGIQPVPERLHIGFLAIAQNPTRQTSTERVLQMRLHLPLLKQPISQVLLVNTYFFLFKIRPKILEYGKNPTMRRCLAIILLKQLKPCHSLNCYSH